MRLKLFCANKEIVDIDILLIQRNGDKKNQAAYQNNDLISHKNEEIRTLKPVQMNIYIYIYNNQGSRRHLLKGQQSHIHVSVAYPTHLNSICEYKHRYDNNIPFKDIWYIYRKKQQPQKKVASQNKSMFQFSWRWFQQQRH